MIFFLILCLSGSAYATEVAETSIEEVRTTTRHGFTTGIVLPQPLSIGYEVIYPELPSLHFFVEGGYFTLPLSGRLKRASIWSVEVGTRWFPFQNCWYLSGTLGFRQIGLSTDISNLKLDGVSLANNADLTLNAAIAGVTVGGQWYLSPKVAFTAELGLQLPIPSLHGGKTRIVQDVPDGTDLSVDDADALSRITSIPVPQIALARFIWYID